MEMKRNSNIQAIFNEINAPKHELEVILNKLREAKASKKVIEKLDKLIWKIEKLQNFG